MRALGLTADGLRVSGLSSDGLLMRFSGTAAQVEAAFHTGLESYRLRDGFTGRATTSAVPLPATIAGSVAAVLGLDDLVQEQPAGIVRAPASDRGKIRAAATANFSYPAGSPKACTAATRLPHQFGGLTDDQIAHAYGAFGLYGSGDFGAGQHIAIYELEPFLRSDVKTFDTCYFGATAAAQMLTRLHVYSVDGGQPAGPGSGEAIPRRRGRLGDRARRDHRRLRRREPGHRRHRSTTRSTSTRRSSTPTPTRS